MSFEARTGKVRASAFPTDGQDIVWEREIADGFELRLAVVTVAAIAAILFVIAI